MWYRHGSISNVFATCAFLVILCLFYCSPPHHTTNMANVSSIVDVFWPYVYKEGIWVFKLFLMLWLPISECYFWAWEYVMLAKMQCLCSGGKNKVVWGIMILGSSPMGMRWMTGWYLCTMLVLEPKERLFILLFKVVFKILIFNTQTPLENKNDDTNQNFFSQVMMDQQGW